MKINQNSNQDKITRSSSGFTLVESAVALAISAIMFTSLYGAFASGFATVRVSREGLRATQIMLSKVESVRVGTFDQLTNPAYYPRTFTETFDPKDEAIHEGGAVYSGTFKTAVPAAGSLPESYRTNMLLVTVSVTWTSGKMQHSRSTQCYAAREGMSGYVSLGR